MVEGRNEIKTGELFGREMSWGICPGNMSRDYVRIPCAQRPTAALTAQHAIIPLLSQRLRLVAWHSGRMLVFDRGTFPVLHSTYS